MSQEYPPPPPPTSRVRLVLLAAWAALTAAAVGFVLTFGTNCPYADEWGFVPELTGHEPAGPWLWDQHNEHRLPLPRLVYLVLFRLTHDFRAGMLLQVALLSGLSLGLMRLAARLRGRPHWADVFFPASLLHAGHWENLLMGYQVCFTLYAVLAVLLGVVALRTTPATAFRSGMAAGVLALLLALCGGFGLIVALPVAGWLLYLAAVVGRTGSAWRAAVLAALALLPAAYLALYLDGYHRPGHHPPPSAAREPGTAVVIVTAQTVAMAIGIGLRGSWSLVFVGIFLLGLFTLNALLRNLNSPADRPSAVGLLAVAAGVVGVALAIGVGRAGLGEKMGLTVRYALLTWPLLGLAYLFWVQRGGRAGVWVTAGLCLAAAVAFPQNTVAGLGEGMKLRTALGPVEADIRAGVPAEEVAARHFTGTPHAGRVARAVPLLRESGW